MGIELKEHTVGRFLPLTQLYRKIELPPVLFTVATAPICVIGENEKWKIPALNATIAVPVIVQAIKEISESSQSSGSTFEQYAWYKTLVFLMQRAVKDDDRKYRKLLNDPLRTAELLLNDNSAQTLKLLSRVSSLQGRGE